MTKLSPLEETLFQAWARANGVDNHDDPNNFFDHRGLYKESNGLIHPRGLVSSLAQTHNKGVEASQETEGGDTVNPDPFMAQAEMHKANLDHKSKERADQIKFQLERMKMEHASMEKEKDRAHKSQLEQMKMQQKAQAEQMKAQMQAQQAEKQMQAQAQMADQDRQANMQQADADRQANAQQTAEDRQFQMQNSDMDRKHEMAVTEKQAAMKPVAAPKPQGSGGGLQSELTKRAVGGGMGA